MKRFLSIFLSLLLITSPLFAETKTIKTPSDLLEFAKNSEMQDKVLIENYQGLNQSLITRIFSSERGSVTVRTIKIYQNKLNNTKLLEDATLICSCDEEIKPECCEVIFKKSEIEIENNKEKILNAGRYKITTNSSTNSPNIDYFFDIPFTYKMMCRSIITRDFAKEKQIALETLDVNKQEKPSILTVLFGVPLFVLSFAAPVVAPVVSPVITGVSQAATTVGIGAMSAAVQGVAGGVGANMIEEDVANKINTNQSSDVTVVPECVFENFEKSEK
ncbi:hypothetical protein [Thermodesulfovibrio sp. TK110]